MGLRIALCGLLETSLETHGLLPWLAADLEALRALLLCWAAPRGRQQGKSSAVKGEQMGLSVWSQAPRQKEVCPGPGTEVPGRRKEKLFGMH